MKFIVLSFWLQITPLYFITKDWKHFFYQDYLYLICSFYAILYWHFHVCKPNANCGFSKNILTGYTVSWRWKIEHNNFYTYLSFFILLIQRASGRLLHTSIRSLLLHGKHKIRYLGLWNILLYTRQLKSWSDRKKLEVNQ